MRTRTSTAPDDAKRVTMQVSTVGIVCNAALTVFKLVAGIVAHSSAKWPMPCTRRPTFSVR